MFPFRSRWRWLLASRHSHLLRAFEGHPVADSLVQERLASIARWNRLRTAVLVLLYLGLLAALASVVAQIVPAFSEATATLEQAARVTGAFTGLLTVAYLFLTRLLGLLETDMWALLSLK